MQQCGGSLPQRPISLSLCLLAAINCRPVKLVRAMPVPVQTSRSYPPQVVVTSARRQRFLRRVATVVTALAAFVAVLVVSIISLALGLTWGQPWHPFPLPISALAGPIISPALSRSRTARPYARWMICERIFSAGRKLSASANYGNAPAAFAGRRRSDGDILQWRRRSSWRCSSREGWGRCPVRAFQDQLSAPSASERYSRPCPLRRLRQLVPSVGQRSQLRHRLARARASLKQRGLRVVHAAKAAISILRGSNVVAIGEAT